MAATRVAGTGLIRADVMMPSRIKVPSRAVTATSESLEGS
jgi:hypothetical protein